MMPFALKTGYELRGVVVSFGPAVSGSPEYKQQVDEIVALSAGLTDRQKAIAEFWTDGVNTEHLAGHWLRIAEWVSQRDHYTLDDDVTFFFVTLHFSSYCLTLCSTQESPPGTRKQPMTLYVP